VFVWLWKFLIALVSFRAKVVTRWFGLANYLDVFLSIEPALGLSYCCRPARVVVVGAGEVLWGTELVVGAGCHRGGRKDTVDRCVWMALGWLPLPVCRFAIRSVSSGGVSVEWFQFGCGGACRWECSAGLIVFYGRGESAGLAGPSWPMLGSVRGTLGRVTVVGDVLLLSSGNFCLD